MARRWIICLLELAKRNEVAIEKIYAANSFEELVSLFDEMYGKYFLNYNVKINEFKEGVLKDEKFKKLPLKEQKEIFARMLDLNQLYVNISDIEDSNNNLSKDEIEATKDFYQISK